MIQISILCARLKLKKTFLHIEYLHLLFRLVNRTDPGNCNLERETFRRDWINEPCAESWFRCTIISLDSALVPRLPFSPVSPCIPVIYRNHGRIPGPLFVTVYRCTRAAATRPATAGQVIRTHGPCSSTFLSCPVSGGPGNGEAASYVESYNFSFDRIFLPFSSYIYNFYFYLLSLESGISPLPI